MYFSSYTMIYSHKTTITAVVNDVDNEGWETINLGFYQH